MSDQGDSESYDPEMGERGPAKDRSGPYEFPALDEPSRFWAEKWAEFKRLFIMLAWENHGARMSIILGWGAFFGVWLWSIVFE